VTGDPLFVTALHSPSADVRLSAVEVWTAASHDDLPTALTDLRSDSDPRVRAATMGAFGRLHNPHLQAWLAEGTADRDLTVRLAAIVALGQLGGPEALALLSQLRVNQPEAIRAAAVSALAQVGARQQVCESLNDKSWLVRAAVADATSAYADTEGAAMAQRLLQDRSADVQRRAVVAVGRWPLEFSGPVLLAAMDRPAYPTRKLAMDQLAARWRPGAEFPLEAPSERRQVALEQLRQRFRQEFGLPNRSAAVPVAAAGNRPGAKLAPERIDEVERLVQRVGDSAQTSAERQQAAHSLTEFGDELVPALEQLALASQRPLPEPIYRDVLPKCGAPFNALDRLASDDLSERRRAADSLVVTAAQRPLGPLAVARLASLVLRQQDALVWLAALTAVESDPGEAAIGLAYAALSHPAGEVRRRACLSLAAHPDPRHEQALVPALDDTNESVVVAAVQALGQLGRMSDSAPMKARLAAPNEVLRVEVAGALAKLGDPQGCEALERQAYSNDSTVRRRAAVLMGEAAGERFVPILIQLLDDPRMSVRQAALENLPKVAPQNPARSDSTVSLETDEQIRRWKAWYGNGGRAAVDVGRKG
jgi:HEAT repeat protein